MDEADDPIADFLENIEYEIDDADVEEFSAQAAAFFAPDGPLQHFSETKGRHYEYRLSQQQMAQAVARSLAKGENICVEAPTGVGKSFAYLVPMIFRAMNGALPSVISTETINLQEQLVRKDLPLLRQITGLPFKAALAKGRGNYLCKRRFSLLSGDRRDSLLPLPSQILDLDRLQQWQEDPQCTGERDALPNRIAPELWSMVNCESGNCLGQKCPFIRECCYFRARRSWESAQIIVANHALFFTDLRMRAAGEEPALLPNYGAVVIDEAHTLESNAAEHLGLHLSRFGVISTLNRLYNPENAKGLLLHAGSEMLELRQLAADARDEAYAFFKPYEEMLLKTGKPALRLGAPDSFEEHLSGTLLNLCEKLNHYLDTMEEQEDKSFQTELESQRDRCAAFVEAIDAFRNRQDKHSVYYIESERNSIVLRGAPLNVSELLKTLLFDTAFPVGLCSATLTVNRKFDYFNGRVGFTNGSSLALSSPFPPENVRVFVPQSIPEYNAPDFPERLAEEIKTYLTLSAGRAFVLFTSYTQMRDTAEAVRDFLYEKGWQLLLQGESLSRSAMLKEFKEDIHSVLFGTDSFWTGVDVPGEALSNVIITKLPFPVPTHPLVEARSEEVEKIGLSSFTHYSLPEAVLKFRQGVGRLIRRCDDTGIIVILDRRIISKSYGRAFVRSMPYQMEVVP